MAKSVIFYEIHLAWLSAQFIAVNKTCLSFTIYFIARNASMARVRLAMSTLSRPLFVIPRLYNLE